MLENGPNAQAKLRAVEKMLPEPSFSLWLDTG